MEKMERTKNGENPNPHSLLT